MITGTNRNDVGSYGARSRGNFIERKYYDAFGTVAPSSMFKSKRYGGLLDSLDKALGDKDGKKEIMQHSYYNAAFEFGEFSAEDVDNAARLDAHDAPDYKFVNYDVDKVLENNSLRNKARHKINNGFVAMAKVFGDSLERCPLNVTMGGSLAVLPPTKFDNSFRRGYVAATKMDEDMRGAANTYMRARTSFAVASALRLFDTFGVAQQQEICRFVSDKIQPLEVKRIVRALCGDYGSMGPKEAVYAHAHPASIRIHIACLGAHLDSLAIERQYERVHSAPPRMTSTTTRSVNCTIKDVLLEAQGLSAHGDNNKEAWGLLVGGFKKVWGHLHHLISKTGAFGTIMSMVFMFKLLHLINVKVNKWVFLGIIALCNHAYLRLVVEDIANCFQGDISDFVGTADGTVMAKVNNLAIEQGHTSAELSGYHLHNRQRRRQGLETVTEEDYFGDYNFADCEPQSGGLLRTAIISGFMLAVGKRVPLYTKIVNAQKFRSGVEEVLDGGVDAFEKFANFLLKSFGSDRVVDFKRQQSAVKKRASAVEGFCYAARGGGMKLDETAHQTYLEYYAQCVEELTKWPRDSSEWRCANKTLETLVKLSTDYPAHFNEARARIEPIGLMMAGPPGIGKTYLLTHMAKVIVYSEKPTEQFDMSRHTFQRPTGEYWEGYKGQMVLCFDDIFTKQPVAGETNGDAEMVVKVINQWPLSLNMANCALKGRFYMTSPFVLATTNMTSKDALGKAVVDPNAIIRRFPLWYDVRLKEGKRCEPGCDPDSTWDFYLKDFNNPTSNTAVRESFTEVMTKLIRERRRRMAFFEQTLGNDANCKNMALGIIKNIELEPQGAAISALKFTVGVGAKVGGAAAATAACAYAGARVVAGTARKCCRATFEDAAGVIRSVGGKVLAYAALAILLFVTTIRAVSGFRKGRNDARSRVEPQSAHKRDEVAELVQRNMFEVRAGGVKIGYALGLDDMTLVMPLHFKRQADKSGVTLTAVGGSGVHISPIKVKSEDETTDQVFFHVKTQCRSLVGSHVSSHPSEKRLLIVFPDKIVRSETTHQPTQCEYPDYTGGPTRFRRIYSHTTRLERGDCGAVIMGATGKYGRRVYGMHTAGTIDEHYYAGRFTVFRPHNCVAQSLDTFQGHKVIERLAKPVHNGGDTRLEATPYAGLFGEVETAPSSKRPKDGVDPMLKAVEGYKREWGDIPCEIEPCVDAVMSELHLSIKDYELGPVSLWEAAAGLEDTPYGKGLARGKSPGYPFILKYKDKRKMLGEEGPYVQGPAWQELVASANDLISKYREGGKGAIFRDSLKDEPRSIEKVSTCSTRMISGCPVEMAVVGRTQTLRYTSAIMQTRHDHGMMPGLNPYSLEAAQLHDRLASMNKNEDATAGDYKAFDKSQHPTVMSMIWSRITDFLATRGCDREVLEGLGRDTIQARHLGGNCYSSDVVYEVDGTLPSGHWMTSLLNSMYNAVVLRYCWVKYAGLRAIYDFKQFVAAVYYGDDFICSVSHAAKGFDLTFLQDTVTHLGLTMTDEDGNYGGAPTKPLRDTTFLCRKFRVDESGYVWMPLLESSINDMFNWKKKSTTVQEHTEAIARASLMEAAAHDFGVFVKYYNGVKRIAEQVRVRMAELQLDERAAYNHWRRVHKGHVPIWTPEEDRDMTQPQLEPQSAHIEPQARIVPYEPNNITQRNARFPTVLRERMGVKSQTLSHLYNNFIKFTTTWIINLTQKCFELFTTMP